MSWWTISALLPKSIFPRSFSQFPPLFPAWWTSPSDSSSFSWSLSIYGIKPTLAALWLPVLLLLAVLTALGVGLWMSALNALYRDVRYVVPFLVQFWMFASPVAYPSSLVPQRWRWLYGLNPMAGVIDGFRWALTGHGVAPGPLMLASASAVMVVLLGGLFFFQRMEGTVADRV